MSKITSHQKGLYAETLAAILLTAKGYRVLEKRYKTRFGEIDIIAKKGDILAFIEVKARGNLETALEAISVKAQTRIANAAQMFLASHPEFADFGMRFDVVSVQPNRLPVHYQNMWQCR